MQTLSDKDKRTLRVAGIGIAIYLVIFFALTTWKKLETRRAAYTKLLQTARQAKQEALGAENKVLLARKLTQETGVDPKKLVKTTLVAQASAAIQTAAREGGLKLGPMRESPARPTARELASIQLEGLGQVPQILGFCQKLEKLGYPIVIETLQFGSPGGPGGPGGRGGPGGGGFGGGGPGMLKVTMTIVLLDFEAWKGEEVPRA
jgi:uncharacterized membrane protein YgcG